LEFSLPCTVGAAGRSRRARQEGRSEMSTGTHTPTRMTQADGRHSVVAKSYPAPARLSTPTDLTAQEARAITAALNPPAPDLFALYLKTKNFHWHLAGAHFRDYHLLFDEQADQIFEAVDLLAERVRRVGGTTIRSVGHIGQLQTIADDNREFVPAPEMAQRLM